jgi:hypothetical protein
MASHAFAPLVAARRRISLAEIDAAVTRHLGATRGLGKSQPACFNRQMAMYLAKHLDGWSTTVIGRYYNGRDHSTVCHGIQRISALREINEEVQAALVNLEKALREPERAFVENPPVMRQTSIKLDKLRDDILLDKLADRIASRLVLLLGGEDVQPGHCQTAMLLPHCRAATDDACNPDLIVEEEKPPCELA